MTTVGEKGSLFDTLTNCPCCDSTSLDCLPAPKYWIAPEHFEAVNSDLGLTRCRDCRLVITNPRPSNTLLNSFYHRPGYDCHDPQHDHGQERHAVARFEVLERLSRKGTLLDYGCGSGNMLRVGRARGWRRVIGVELSANPRNRLLEEGFEVYPDVSSVQKLTGSIDAVAMIQVLEHLENLRSALRQVWQILHPDGVFVVEVPNAGSLRARIAGSVLANVLTNPVQRYQAYPIHLYYFEPSQLAMLLRKNGFQILEIHTLGMGVEEFWTGPSPASPADDSSVQRVRRHDGLLQSTSKFRLLRKATKTGISKLRLGEHLFAVCRKTI